MNANDIFTALTGIDEKYIDEAAYELHSGDSAAGSEDQVQAGKVVDITSRRRIGKFVKIVLPSVAAIILIVAFALPAVLRVTDNTSTAPMSESAAPAAADEAAAEAPAEDESSAAAAEAPAAAGDNFEPIAEAPAAATEEAEEVSEDAAVAETETAGAETETVGEAAREDNSYKAKLDDDSQMLTAAKGLTVSKADYKDGILTIEFDSDFPAGLADTPYRLTRSDTGDGSPVSEGVLSELSDHIETEDNRLIIDLTGNEPAPGSYRIYLGDISAEFEVH